MNVKRKARVFSVVLIGSILTACSSAGDVRSRPPAFSVTSQKNARDVAGCISDRLAEKYSGYVHTVSTRLTANGYIIVWEQQIGGWGKSVAATIDVKDVNDKKSDVSVYLAWDMTSSVTQTINAIVEGCTK